MPNIRLANLVINFDIQRAICLIFVIDCTSSRCIYYIGMKHIISIFIALSLSFTVGMAQEKIEGVMEADKIVHNFGNIMLGSGPVSCTFNLTNISEKPVVIYNVVSTCGCTDVTWTKAPIRPGEKAEISVTYSNDEGAYPFDKTLTAYISDIKKPVLFKIRGVSTAEAKPLEDLYPVTYGPLAIRESMMKCGNLEQGRQKSDAVLVANLSDKPIKVTFGDISEHLEVSVSPNPIPARSTAEMSFTVTASRDLWGKNRYWATPQIDGKAYKNASGDSRMGFWAFTKENFSHMTELEKDAGSRPAFTTSSFDAGRIKKGDMIHAEFTFTNEGKDDFRVYKVDADTPKWSHSDIPYAKPGQKVTFRVHLDSSTMEKGESLTIITLTTNSPLRPLVNLFVSAVIE